MTLSIKISKTGSSDEEQPKKLGEISTDYAKQYALLAMEERQKILEQTSAIRNHLESLTLNGQLNIAKKQMEIAALGASEQLGIVQKQMDSIGKHIENSLKQSSEVTRQLESSYREKLFSGTQNIETVLKTLSSFNLYPNTTFDSYLKDINHSNSISEALSKDWQNVGSDLWKSHNSVLKQKLKDNNE